MARALGRDGASCRHCASPKSRRGSQFSTIVRPALPMSQIRNRGTIGGSVAEADPSGRLGRRRFWPLPAPGAAAWAERANARIAIEKFFLDAYTSALAPDELVSEIIVKTPQKGSGGAYIAFKRSAPVYATASAAVQLTLEGDTCRDARIVLGAVGLTPLRAPESGE